MASDSTPTIQDRLAYLNDILLIPMFTVMIIDIGYGQGAPSSSLLMGVNLFICGTFLLEWAVGLFHADRRLRYLRSPLKLADLVSSIPLGYFFQGLRVLRVLRAARLLRAVWRTRRYRGPARQALRILGAAGSIAVAGALALMTLEPDTVGSFEEAAWWSIVTLTTVGYGDIAPATGAGRLVGGFLMVIGVGFFGYMAGFIGSILDDPADDAVLAKLDELESQMAALTKALETAT